MLILRAFCHTLSSGKARLLFGANVDDYSAIAVTAIDASKWDILDEINEENEAIRVAANAGVEALKSLVK